MALTWSPLALSRRRAGAITIGTEHTTIAAFRAQAHRLRAAYFGQAVRNLWSAFTHRVKAARARNQLAALPDYILCDIGLSRAEIPAAVAGDRSLRRHSEPAVAAVDLASTTKPAEEKLAA